MAAISMARGVDDPQPIDPMDMELRIDNGIRIAADAARADGVVGAQNAVTHVFAGHDAT